MNAGTSNLPNILGLTLWSNGLGKYLVCRIGNGCEIFAQQKNVFLIWKIIAHYYNNGFEEDICMYIYIYIYMYSLL